MALTTTADAATEGRPSTSPVEGRDPASFRDPSGFVFWRGGLPHRRIEPRFAGSWDAFADSSFATDLVKRGFVLPWESVEPVAPHDDGAHAIIRTERIEFISYPYEWTFGQLRDAALLTLDIQSLAVGHGFTLRDASAFNIQFRHGRPDPHRHAVVRAASSPASHGSPTASSASTSSRRSR